MSTARVGAWLDDAGAHFRVWAPSAARVELLLEGTPQAIPLTPAAEGMFALDREGPSKGRRYRYRVDGRDPVPDPASRWQPDGVHGASAIDDPRAFAWSSKPRDIVLRDAIIYELHTGTFTDEGTFDAAIERLPYLRDLGVTAIELMPIAEFAGSRNWGYDGVALFAPSSVYGGPDGLRRFVDAAHRHNLSVILDIVYNHLGPDGAYLKSVSPEFFHADANNPWGDAPDLENPVVRAWLIANAIHWANDYRIDGFRLDATHALPEAGAASFLRELISATRAETGRPIVFIAEDHRNLAEMVRPIDRGGWGLDGVWADDFHHHVRVLTAGDRHGYYSDFSGAVPDLCETMTRGWYFCGQHSQHLGHARGTDPSGVLPEQFVVCIQNHDQVGNRAFGDRLHHAIGLDAWRAASAVLLLGRGTPLLFMGQEWAATSPFQYFTDHHEELGRQVTDGRRREFRHFPEFQQDASAIPDPQAEETFAASRLRWNEIEEQPHKGMLDLYRALLKLRRSERLLQPDPVAMDAGTIGLHFNDHALVARLKGAGRVDVSRTLPGAWTSMLTTEDAPFAEAGAPPVLSDGTIAFACPSAMLLRRV